MEPLDGAADVSPAIDAAAGPANGRRVGGVIAAVLTGAVVVAVIAAIGTVVLTSRPASPLVGAAVRGTPTASAGVDLSPEPSGTALGETTAASAPPSGSTVDGASGGCDANPRVTVSVPAGHTDGARLFFELQSTRSGEPVCGSAEVYVSWVSYFYTDDGRQFMHGGAGFMVPTQTRTWTPTVQVDEGCKGDLYVIARGVNFTPLAPGAHHPLPGASAGNGWTGEIASFINEPVVCTRNGRTYPGPGAPPPPPPPPPPAPSSSSPPPPG